MFRVRFDNDYVKEPQARYDVKSLAFCVRFDNEPPARYDVKV